MGWWILIFIVVVLGSFFMLAVSNATAAAEKIVARQNEVQAEFPTDEFFMSELDGHFIGFSFDRGVVVLGDMIFAKEYLFSEISSVDHQKWVVRHHDKPWIAASRCSRRGHRFRRRRASCRCADRFQKDQ